MQLFWDYFLKKSVARDVAKETELSLKDKWPVFYAGFIQMPESGARSSFIPKEQMN